VLRFLFIYFKSSLHINEDISKEPTTRLINIIMRGAITDNKNKILVKQEAG
jgi:hypothetical protein